MPRTSGRKAPSLRVAMCWSVGYFVEPTIVRDIGDDARWSEEQFSPILPVLRYSESTQSHAPTLEFGLGGTWSEQPRSRICCGLANRIGTVWINRHLSLQPDVPFSGAKQSGIGVELGREGLQQYTQPRIISMAK